MELLELKMNVCVQRWRKKQQRKVKSLSKFIFNWSPLVSNH